MPIIECSNQPFWSTQVLAGDHWQGRFVSGAAMSFLL